MNVLRFIKFRKTEMPSQINDVLRLCQTNDVTILVYERAFCLNDNSDLIGTCYIYGRGSDVTDDDCIEVMIHHDEYLSCKEDIHEWYRI